MEGCRNGAWLWRDLRDAGFKGGMRVVTEWASRQRLAAQEQQPGPAPAPVAQPPIRPAAYPARRVARIPTLTWRRLPSRTAAMSSGCWRCRRSWSWFAPWPDALMPWSATAVRMRSPPWLAEAQNSGLRGFAAGLRQDEQAVRAALMLPWSSGQVEGQVSRLKLVKRQGYGRAGLNLLRARLIRAAG